MTLIWILGATFLVIGITCLVIVFDGVESRPRLYEGRRGMARTRALQTSSLFSVLEPMVRKLVPICGRFVPQRIDARAASLAERSGYWLGVDAIEFVVLSILCAPLGLLAGLVVGGLLDRTHLGGMLGLMLGASFPLLRLNNATLARHTAIGRELPGAIDLAALCMAAGLDFSASLTAIVQQSRGRRTPLIEEFEQILRSLELGNTRSHALADFARATPIAVVEEFSAAVTQAEQKGTPLSDVLAIQASTMRMRRSVAAEEAAARAAVMLIIPLLLLMGSVLLILIGPFIINGFGI